MKYLRYMDFVYVAVVGISFGILFFVVTLEVAKFIIMAVISILLYDLATKFFLRGGRGIIQIRLGGSKTVARSYGYLVFICMIFVATLISSTLADSISTFLLISYWSKIVAGFLVAGIAYGELIATYYFR